MLKFSKEQLKFFKENYPYTDNGFFSLKGYIEECVGKNWRNKGFSIIIQAIRNMGKSYGSWDFIEQEIWIKSNFTERVAYCRTNLTKLKPVKSFFNSKYAGKYLMTDTHIWKIELDEKGKEIKEKRIELGAVIGIMNEENWRSGEFANYRMLFWDEYNESSTQKDIYVHFVNLLKTVERMTPNFITLLVGNKINANNDILVNLEIEIPDYEAQEEDYLVVRKDNNGNDRIFFVDIADKTFEHLQQKEKTANIWALYNDKTDAFLNGGGYLELVPDNVLIYRTRILPTAKVKYYVCWGPEIYEYGEFEGGVYFNKVINYPPNALVLSLDVLGDMYYSNGKKMLNKQDYIDFATNMQLMIKNKQLFFTSFQTKSELERFILKYVSLV